MSPTQAKILGFLRQRSPEIVGSYELRDECVPGRDVKNIHVQIFHLRRQGIPVRSCCGPYGGYWVDAA